MSKDVNVESIEAQIKELVNKKDISGQTPLSVAAKDGKLKEVKYLVDNGADVNLREKSGHTSLWWAAHFGHLETVQYLVEHGADANIKVDTGNTSLHSAAMQGFLEVVKFLSKSSDVTLRNYNGKTASAVAKENGHMDVALFLKNLEVIKEDPNKRVIGICGDKEVVIGGFSSSCSNKYSTVGSGFNNNCNGCSIIISGDGPYMAGVEHPANFDKSGCWKRTSKDGKVTVMSESEIDDFIKEKDRTELINDILTKVNKLKTLL